MSLLKSEKLSMVEKNTIERTINEIIAKHKGNSAEINRLAFDSVTALATSERKRNELCNKNALKRIWGGLNGSNNKLQSGINHSLYQAQYASIKMLQKLAEYNLMSFEMITAVNNKLNLSLIEIDKELQTVAIDLDGKINNNVLELNQEINTIYKVLFDFFKESRSDIVRVENRVSEIEKNIDLLKWQATIEYLNFEGFEYSQLSNISKLVCLTIDFYSKTGGNWSFSDLMLLKATLNDLGVQINEFIVIEDFFSELERVPKLREKLINEICVENLFKLDPMEVPLIYGVLKEDNCQNKESYIVDTLWNLGCEVNPDLKRPKVLHKLIENYLVKYAGINPKGKVKNFDLVLELLHGLNIIRSADLLSYDTYVNTIDDLNLGMKLYYERKYKEALAFFKSEIEKDNPRAMYYYGQVIDNLYVKNDKKIKSSELYERGAQKGDVLCIYQLLLLNRSLCENGKEKFYDGYNLMKQLADSGNLDAINNIGLMYCNGDGVEKDVREAVNYFENAAQAGLPIAMSNLGWIYSNSSGVTNDEEKAVEWYKKAAEAGLPSAMLTVAERYFYGRGVKEDKDEAFTWYKQAAIYGIGEAMLKLGDIYITGERVTQNEEKAAAFYKEAADCGLPSAMFKIAELEFSGCGLAENKEEAIKWYKLAASAGMSDAMYNLGNIYVNGLGVPTNIEEAVKCFKDSAEAGNMQAALTLGTMYECGKENYILKDDEEAAKWYKLAAEAGLYEAMCKLGKMYFKGNGVEKKIDKSVKWLEKAAAGGIPEAMFLLACLYGKGKNKDEEKALKYYVSAAELGMQEAVNYLGGYYKHKSFFMSGNDLSEVEKKDALKWIFLSDTGGAFKVAESFLPKT